LYTAAPTESPRKNKPKTNKKYIPGVWPMFSRDLSAVHKRFTQQQLFAALDAGNSCFSIGPPKQQLFFIEGL